MTTIPDDLMAARRDAKAEYAASITARLEGRDRHTRTATERVDAARRALKAADDALDDWFDHAVGRKG